MDFSFHAMSHTQRVQPIWISRPPWRTSHYAKGIRLSTDTFEVLDFKAGLTIWVWNIYLIVYIAGQQYRQWQAILNSQEVGRGLRCAGVSIRDETRRIVRRRAQVFDLLMLPQTVTSWEAEVWFGPSHTQGIWMSSARRGHKEEQAGKTRLPKAEVVFKAD